MGVHSELGKGSTFWFTARFEKQVAIATGTDGRDVVAEASILIAEDDRTNQEVALGLLRKLGYGADTAANGLAVLEAFQSTDYDIVLMDCQMPEMDGYETTRRIRAQRANFSQPYIIAMTAHATQGDREKCLAAGMNDYVSKPVVLEAFAAALARGWPRGAKATLLNNKWSGAGAGGAQDESPRALCKKTLQGLRELGSDMGASFFPELLKTFEHDAGEYIAALRSAIGGGKAGQLRGEAHALKGSSLTIGAKSMAEICQQLEKLGASQVLAGALEKLAQLEREFDRVKNEIELEISC